MTYSGAMLVHTSYISLVTNSLSLQLQVVVAYTKSIKELSATQASRLYREANVSAIVGPPFNCNAAGKVASLFDRAMISYVSIYMNIFLTVANFVY